MTSYDTPEKLEKRKEEIIIKPFIEKAQPLNWAWQKLEDLGYTTDKCEADYAMGPRGGFKS